MTTKKKITLEVGSSAGPITVTVGQRGGVQVWDFATDESAQRWLTLASDEHQTLREQITKGWTA